MMRHGGGRLQPIKYLVLLVLVLLWIAPMYVVCGSSIKTPRELFEGAFRLPESLNLANYVIIWKETRLLRYMLNSAIVTFAALAIIVAISSLAAYAIHRSRVMVTKSLYYLFVLGLMIPTQVGLVTIFLTMKSFGLYNTLHGMILLYSAVSMPVSVFIFTGFFRDMPPEMFEAAVMDGAGEFGIYRRIVMPLSRNVFSTVVIINGVFVWNDFAYALVLIKDVGRRTLQYGLYALKGEYISNYPLIFAGVVIISLPIIAIYVVFQKQFIRGMTAGAVKG